jgi:hypothetical protein
MFSIKTLRVAELAVPYITCTYVNRFLVVSNDNFVNCVQFLADCSI